ncbi:MAG: cytochrome c oxidase subunit 3 [Alphaproteobacteria bacterium]|nr:cytochrome c oxidase subunit 3 [Alphaproteobacteria bacterium]
MAESAAHQKHPYHLVDPSPWPVVGALSAGTLAVGAVLMMHKVTPWLVVVGFLMVLATMFLWWRQVVRESIVQKAHTPVVKIGLRYGVALFIASEVMFFVAFFWAFFDASLFPKAMTSGAWVPADTYWVPVESITKRIGIWPPKGVETFAAFELPFLNTLVLLLSGTTVTWAHHCILHDDRKGAVRGLAITVLLGLAFTGLQAYEYSHAKFSFAEGIYPSTFFMATGFHGFHVIIGTLFLAVCLFRAWKGHFTSKSHFGFEAAAWYWHFVDVVWLFLFCGVYWWGG